MVSYLVKLLGGGQVEEHLVVLNLDWEGQELHVVVLHVVQALAADRVQSSGRRLFKDKRKVGAARKKSTMCGKIYDEARDKNSSRVS